MSRFYASIEGNRGMATRQGTPNSGIRGHIRGWDIGARVECHVDEEGKDHVMVWRTGGSRGYGNSVLIADFTKDESFPV